MSACHKLLAGSLLIASLLPAANGQIQTSSIYTGPGAHTMPAPPPVGPAGTPGPRVFYTDSNSFGPTTPVYIYDVTGNSWSTAASLPGANTTQLAADESGTVYALIEDGNIYRYDSAGNSWVLVKAGPAASIGRNNISFFEAHNGEFYWGRDFTTDLYYTTGGTWHVVTAPRMLSCSADVDRASGQIYIRTVSALGFMVFDPTSVTFPIICDQGDGQVGEDSRVGVLYAGEFFSREFTGNYQAVKASDCSIRDTGTGPSSFHSATAGDGAGSIYSNGWDVSQTIFERYDIATNTITSLAAAPTIPDNSHSTLAFSQGGCDASSSSSNYGTGWPGTNGIPSFTAASDPDLGSSVTLNLSNSLGANTTGFLVIGFATLSAKTDRGGTLLVLPYGFFPIAIPAGGAALVGSIPNDPALCALAVYLQAVENDPGASHGVSFTAGLQLVLGS